MTASAAIDARDLFRVHRTTEGDAAALQGLSGGGAAGGGVTPGASVSVVAVEGSNSIALRGDATTVSRLAQVAADLDARARNGTEIRVVFLENADAEQLLPVLQQLVGQFRY